MTNKYLMIHNDLVRQIEAGEFAPRALLPSEHELKDHYKTSRETIRKALTLLAQQGYIQKVRGKGSIVIKNAKLDFPVSGLVSFHELAQKMGEMPRTIVHELSLLKPDQYIKQQLNLSGKDQVWQISRIREISGERVILDKDYLNEKFVPHITKEICEHSIFDYLENELNLTISFAKKEIIVEEPDEEDKRLLDLEGFHNIVIIKNYIYLEDTSLFQYTESRHRPDKFRFVDFARRGH
ncbi:trehalose operon repressor [Lederbergia lenta]|uniref:Trehalose operon repressor n=1 Tax=Lederbergia lenta TaxID=1467 RepID=A0A2X4VU95_LEDLE|nr:trehalose operon repressor [Lederbergia lenta]MCM3113262.1 trehalose operon repressor [Lederbergia lenta]MEC2326395.1 trehalose operon repressor [Lederbergia lenta]SQI51398.1 GntR family transcriptional regulator [Lederbergia lenta]